jgi:Tol biopolymer transport system component
MGLAGELIWILPDGSIESIGDGGPLVVAPVVSPDGSRVTFAAGTNPNDMEVWVRDLERGINTRISSLDGFAVPIAWSPDGSQIAVGNFNPSASQDSYKTHFLASNGTGPTREPYPGLLAAFDPEWKQAALASDPRRGELQLSAIDLSDMSVIGEVTNSQGSFPMLSLSPDGELLLYVSNESGEAQIYCTRFPSGEGRWQVSSDGGNAPYWSPDGNAVYYMNSQRELLHVQVTREPALRFGIPQRHMQRVPDIADFADMRPAPDGKRFISVRGQDDEAAAAGYKLQLIENWYEEHRSDR